MPVKIRLMRIGAKKRPFYRIVAVDERKKRTGEYIDLLGTYNPLTEPKEIILKQDKIDAWIKKGAVLSDGYLRMTKQAPQKPPRKPKKPARNASQSDAGGEKKAEPAKIQEVAKEEPVAEVPVEEAPAEASEPVEEVTTEAEVAPVESAEPVVETPAEETKTEEEAK